MFFGWFHEDMDVGTLIDETGFHDDIMSVVINVMYEGSDGAAEAFVGDVVSEGLLDAVRSEDGCLGYEYFRSMEDPDRVPALVCAAVGISTPCDLEASAEVLTRPSRLPYMAHFLKTLRAKIREKHSRFPDIQDLQLPFQ